MPAGRRTNQWTYNYLGARILSFHMIRKRDVGIAGALAILLLAACRKEKLSLPLFREIAIPVAFLNRY